MLIHKTTFNLVDAAGIRDTSVLEESLGVDKMLDSINSFPLILVVCDQEYKTQLVGLKSVIRDNNSLVVKISLIYVQNKRMECVWSRLKQGGDSQIKKMIHEFCKLRTCY